MAPQDKSFPVQTQLLEQRARVIDRHLLRTEARLRTKAAVAGVIELSLDPLERHDAHTVGYATLLDWLLASAPICRSQL